jgi:dipeptidyl aminopeptidase/acylaminoacyl peptidase
MGFYKMDLSNGQAIRLMEANTDLGSALWTKGVEKGRDFYYIEETASRGCDIRIRSTEPESVARRVTHINPVFDRYVMGEARLVEWRSSDGERLRGALMLPAGYEPGKRYPLIVHVYGGIMLSDNINTFGFSNALVMNEQFWATRGYAVLLPDTPLGVGTPMVDLVKTVIPGVDRIVEMGIADPDRLAVWGSSYGGYSTVALIAQTTRFKAAISDAGFANLLTAYGRVTAPENAGARFQGWAETGQGRMGGTPWLYRERYIANSPLFYLDRVRTPLLLILGTEDSLDILSDELFVSLRRLGKEATYLKYEGAGHTILTFSYAEQVDVLNRIISWFDSYLKSPTGGHTTRD